MRLQGKIAQIMLSITILHQTLFLYLFGSHSVMRKTFSDAIGEQGHNFDYYNDMLSSLNILHLFERANSSYVEQGASNTHGDGIKNLTCPVVAFFDDYIK